MSSTSQLPALQEFIGSMRDVNSKFDIARSELAATQVAVQEALCFLLMTFSQYGAVDLPADLVVQTAFDEGMIHPDWVTITLQTKDAQALSDALDAHLPLTILRQRDRPFVSFVLEQGSDDSLRRVMVYIQQL